MLTLLQRASFSMLFEAISASKMLQFPKSVADLTPTQLHIHTRFVTDNFNDWQVFEQRLSILVSKAFKCSTTFGKALYKVIITDDRINKYLSFCENRKQPIQNVPRQRAAFVCVCRRLDTYRTWVNRQIVINQLLDPSPKRISQFLPYFNKEHFDSGSGLSLIDAFDDAIEKSKIVTPITYEEQSDDPSDDYETSSAVEYEPEKFPAICDCFNEMFVRHVNLRKYSLQLEHKYFEHEIRADQCLTGNTRICPITNAIVYDFYPIIPQFVDQQTKWYLYLRKQLKQIKRDIDAIKTEENRLEERTNAALSN